MFLKINLNIIAEIACYSHRDIRIEEGAESAIWC